MKWGDGMLAEDYLDAVAFKENLVPPKLYDWADEMRHKSGVESFQGIG